MKKHILSLSTLLLFWSQIALGQVDSFAIGSFPVPLFKWSPVLSLSADQWKTESIEELQSTAQVIANKLSEIQTLELEEFFKEVDQWTLKVKEYLEILGNKCNRSSLKQLKLNSEKLESFLEALGLTLSQEVYLKLKELDVEALALRIKFNQNLQVKYAEHELGNMDGILKKMEENNAFSKKCNDYSMISLEVVREAGEVNSSLMLRRNELLKILSSLIELTNSK